MSAVSSLSADRFEDTDRHGTADPRKTIQNLDQRAYQLLAAPTNPRFDAAVSYLSNAANHSKLSIAMTGVLAVAGGSRGRQAALTGIVAVGATSAIANLVIKPIARRQRPFRSTTHRDSSRLTDHHVEMPDSYSFPSGHTAAGFAFATGVAHVWPTAAVVPFAVATAVGYSRVHTGVHFPIDVLLGSVLGTAIGAAVGQRRVRLFLNSSALASVLKLKP